MGLENIEDKQVRKIFIVRGANGNHINNRDFFLDRLRAKCNERYLKQIPGFSRHHHLYILNVKKSSMTSVTLNLYTVEGGKRKLLIKIRKGRCLETREFN